MRKALLLLVGSLTAIVLAAVAWIYIDSEMGLRRTYVLAATVPPLPTDAASIARGRHVAHAIASCAFCHGENFAGRVYIDQPPVARIVPSNLTRGRGGVPASMTDLEWVNAIRHGVGRDQRTLLLMPAEVYQAMADDDLGALIAYLKQLPAVDNELPESRLYPMGRMLEAFDKAPFFTAEHVDHDRPAPPPINPGVSVQYGYYLARMGACIGCHGNDLAGRRVPGAPKEIPPAANLTPTGIGHYMEADFIRALREGKRPSGAPINPFMPLATTAQLTDDEMRAIYLYLTSLPPREFGENTSPRSMPPDGGP